MAARPQIPPDPRLTCATCPVSCLRSPRLLQGVRHAPAGRVRLVGRRSFGDDGRDEAVRRRPVHYPCRFRATLCATPCSHCLFCFTARSRPSSRPSSPRRRTTTPATRSRRPSPPARRPSSTTSTTSRWCVPRCEFNRFPPCAPMLCSCISRPCPLLYSQDVHMEISIAYNVRNYPSPAPAPHPAQHTSITHTHFCNAFVCSSSPSRSRPTRLYSGLHSAPSRETGKKAE